MRNKALMTAYAEGSIVSRELREMLSGEVAAERFEREMRQMNDDAGYHETGCGSYDDAGLTREALRNAEVL